MKRPMNAIKKLSPLFLFFLFSCSSSNPKEMARAYCKCFLEADSDQNKLNECAELAAEHKEYLKDPKDAKTYAEEIIRCAVYEQPENR